MKDEAKREEKGVREEEVEEEVGVEVVVVKKGGR